MLIVSQQKIGKSSWKHCGKNGESKYSVRINTSTFKLISVTWKSLENARSKSISSFLACSCISTKKGDQTLFRRNHSWNRIRYRWYGVLTSDGHDVNLDGMFRTVSCACCSILGEVCGSGNRLVLTTSLLHLKRW